VTTVRVVLADDQRVVRDGLAMLLDALDGVELVGSAENGEEAVRLAGEHRPDVVLMDLRMPVLDAVEATRRLRDSLPQVRAVVLTTHADDASVFSALQAGARGYLTKDARVAEIGRVLRLVAAGQALIDPGVQARLLDALDRVPVPPAVPAPGLTGRRPRCWRSSRPACRTPRSHSGWSCPRRRSRPTSTSCSPRPGCATGPRRCLRLPPRPRGNVIGPGSTPKPSK
jgi:DNA-binding NarL/FixJ family response regulator